MKALKALLFEHIPDDCEWRKGAHPQAPLAGTQVYCAAAVKALLEYGTYDRYLFLSRHNESAEFNVLRSPALAPYRERIDVVSPDRLDDLRSYDHLILNTIFVDRIIALRALLRRPEWPIVGTIHSLHGPDTVRNLQALALQRDIYAHDALMCSTHSGKAVVEKLLAAICHELGAALRVTVERPPFKLPVIPLGVFSDHFERDREAARARLEFAPESVVFLYFGRLSPTDKGDLLALLEAFARTVRAAPESVLVIAGDDTQYRLADGLKALASELGCGDAVRLDANPSYERKLDHFAAADVFVSPSDHLQETFGITVAEAMAAGLPAVVSDWDGYRELVTHGETGFRVETWLPRFGRELELSDISRSPVTLLAQSTAIDLDAFASCMTRLAREPELRRRFGAAARAAARERFCWRRVVRDYETLWDGLVEEGRAASYTPSPHGLRWLSDYYQHIYAHYPTRFLEDTTHLALAGERDRASFDRLCAGTQMFSAEIFAQLYGLAAAAGAGDTTIAVGDLVTGLRRQGVPSAAARAHVGRALKLGLLRSALTPTASDSSDSSDETAVAREV
jgi:D-inositol-3-phosphate glycosyltransferase